MTPAEYRSMRDAVAAFPADASTDAHGIQAPTIEEMFAPEAHAAALDPRAPIVEGARGTGKSFWSGVLASPKLRAAAATAYPRLGLDRLEVRFGYTGLPGEEGFDRDRLETLLPGKSDDDRRAAKDAWWYTLLAAIERGAGRSPSRDNLLALARDVDRRQAHVDQRSRELERAGKVLLVIYDALDTVSTTWPRRRLLTETLLELVWSLRAWPNVRPKLFMRPDQLQDDQLRFVELPKLRTGAVRLRWSGTDLFGLFFARLARCEASDTFGTLLDASGIERPNDDAILSRSWTLASDEATQRRLFAKLAGPYMGTGVNAHKKGDTYDWLQTHLADAFAEVTPRSFLGLLIAAAKYRPAPEGSVIGAKGIQHGLREASKTRVDQLHQEFPWIKGLLAPLAGLLLPTPESQVHKTWRQAKTVEHTLLDAARNDYMPPSPDLESKRETALYDAMERIGVMLRRPKDGRLDMPDLFRVAAKLLKKGATTPS